MTVSVSLPTYFTARGPVSTMQVAQRIRWADDDVVVEANALQYADPFGMAVLGASFNAVLRQGHEVHVRGLSPEIRTYLERMNVFDGVSLELSELSGRARNDRSDSLVELTSLRDSRQVDVVAGRLATALIGRIPGVDFDEEPDEMTGFRAVDRLTDPLQYALSELLENALTHARRTGLRDAGVWVASQYYKSSGRLSIGVVDDGCGFLATLRHHSELTAATDHAAILAALKPRVSCNRDLGVMSDTVNQGVGLTTTSRIAAAAGGKLLLVSGNGAHDTGGSLSGSLGANLNWQGVAIAMECRRNLLSAVRFRELLPPLDELPPARLRFE